ncbi:MAG: GFA family protein [Pseudomonadota bacterium]
MSEEQTGGCLCGAVRYRITAPLRPALVCHCGMCQRQHSGPAYYSATKTAALHLEKAETLTWYSASPVAERGFCSACGSSLFWRPAEADYTAVACGSLDQPSGVTAAAHVFLCDQGDYYPLADDLPKFQWGTGGQLPDVESVLPEKPDTGT